MGSSSEEVPGIPPRSEELLEILRKGKTFAEELLRENERLRMKIVSLENERIEAATGEALAELDRLRAENARLRERIALIDKRFADVENENQDFARRYLEVEQQNEALANLYVASYQLHSTLDPAEVATAITDIVVGLIGASDFAVLLVDDETRDLVVSGGEGVEARFPEGRLGLETGLEGRVATTGKAYFGETGTPDADVAVVPLHLKGEVVGIIGIYRLLSQKRGGLTPIDHELLNLLAGQAATALVSSRLYGARDRRQKAMGGFIKSLKES